MKIVEIALALLIFNGCLAIVSYANLTSSPIYYESDYIDTFTPDNLPDNVSTSDETEQYTITMNLFTLILDVADFGWIYYLIPDEIESGFVMAITVLQAIVGFFYVAAFLELFLRQIKVIGDK